MNGHENKISIELNSFIVLESLDEEDKKNGQTGLLLFNQILRVAENEIPEFKGKVHFYEFRSKREFLSILDEIVFLVQKGYYTYPQP